MFLSLLVLTFLNTFVSSANFSTLLVILSSMQGKDEILFSKLCMYPEYGCIHNFRHKAKYTLCPGEDVRDKRWRHSTDPGQSRLTNKTRISRKTVSPSSEWPTNNYYRMAVALHVLDSQY